VKKKKNLIIIISTITILLLGIGGYLLFKDSPKKETTKEEITPLMYEITKEGSNNKIYLFGSIHLANTKEFTFPKYLIDAYNNSHYLACEFDTVAYEKDTERQTQDVLKMLYEDGSTINEHLNSETYEKLVNFLKEKKLYSSLYDVYKPYFFESLITLALANDSNIKSNSGIDDYFLKKAKKDSKTILEVETSDFQTDLLLSFSDSLYEIMINDAIDNYDDEVKSLNELYEAWKEGNPDTLENLSNDDIEIKDEYTKEQIDLINDYNEKIITNRNTTMTDKLIEYFNSNYDVFYMVGAFHLIGDTGIAKQLENKGFTVKQIN